MTDIRDLLRLHEGNKRFPYTDTVGKVTIGVGFNLTDVGLLPEEIDFILMNRIQLVTRELYAALPWTRRLDEARFAVLQDMAYNMGIEPFDHDSVKDWPLFVSQVEEGKYAEAAANMLKTLWARQVKGRAERLATMMRTGQWPVLPR